MGVNLILGRAGSGKTQFCLDEIKTELKKDPFGKPLIFLVPEQATFQLEKEIIDNFGFEAVSRAQVISFRRLAWHVFQETGGIVRPHISDMGKQMLIRKIVLKREAQLKVFPKVVNKINFYYEAARSIAECKLYSITPEDLQESFQEFEEHQDTRQLGHKLHDLSMIYGDLEEFLKDRYTDPDDYLSLLSEKLTTSKAVIGARVWIDGFSGFTPKEHQVLKSIMLTAEEVNIALCMPSEAAEDKLSEIDVFYPVWETYQKMKQLADQVARPINRLIRLDKDKLPRFKDDFLGHIENQYPSWPGQQKKGKPESIALVSASNRRTEVESVARKLVSLARMKDYRWRDMSVMCRSLDPYIELMKTVFSDYGIPVFMDQKQGITHHPLVELIRSGLEIISTHFRYDAVFQYLKTDLVPVNRGEVDWLENYCLANGIKGYAWTAERDWRFIDNIDFENKEHANFEQRQAKADALRRRVVATLEPLLPLLEMEKCSAIEISRAVWQLLTKFEVNKQLKSWQEQDEQQGRLVKAQEHAQVWDKVVELLDQIVEVLGEEKVSLREFIKILEAGLEELKVGLVPPGLDQVIVGNIERSRNPNIKALFFLGLNEGIFPMYKAENQVFSDEERDYLQEKGWEMAPTSKQKLFQEQYLIYISLTRSSEYLWLSYPAADDEGRALKASGIIVRLKELLPDLDVKYLAQYPERDEEIWDYLENSDNLLGLLIAKLRKAKDGDSIGSIWSSVHKYFKGADNYQEKLHYLLKAFDFTISEQKLSEQIINQIYSNPIRTSVSQMEQFSRCPFSHFSRYVLKLKERREFTLDVLNLGKVYHQVLSEFVSLLNKKGLDWGELDEPLKVQIMEEVMVEVEELLSTSSLAQSAQVQFQLKQVKETLSHALDILTEHAKRGSFSPLWVEIPFDEGSQLAPLEISLSRDWQLLIRGRIDRVDTASDGDKTYLRVIDYKSSRMGLNWWQVYHGLQLQLLTYLWAGVNSAPKLLGTEINAAGAFYFPVIRPLVESNGPINFEQINNALRKESKMQGILLGEGPVVELMGAPKSGYSDLLPVYVKKDGTLGKDSQNRLLTKEQMDLALQFTKEKIKQIGEEIISGNIDVSPYRFQKQSPCGYCEYKPVCQFDVTLDGSKYKFLEEVSNFHLWDRMKQSLRGEKL